MSKVAAKIIEHATPKFEHPKSLLKFSQTNSQAFKQRCCTGN